VKGKVLFFLIVLIALFAMGSYYTSQTILNKVLTAGGSSVSGYYTEKTALNLVYDATNTALSVYIAYDSTFSGIDTFVAEKTIDTTLVSGVTASDAIAVSWRDASGDAASPLFAWTTAGSLFVRRIEADTNVCSIYQWNRTP